MKTVFALLILTLALQETLSWNHHRHHHPRRRRYGYHQPLPYYNNRSGYGNVHTGGKAFAIGNGHHGSANAGSKSGIGGSTALSQGAIASGSETHYGNQMGFKSNHFGFN